MSLHIQKKMSLFRFLSVSMLVLICSSRSAEQFHNTFSHMVKHGTVWKLYDKVHRNRDKVTFDHSVKL